MYLRSLQPLPALGAALLAAGLTISAPAAEYQIQPSVDAQTSYDSNLLLGSDGREIKSFLLEFTPRLIGRMSTGKWQASVDGSLTLVRLEDDDFDSDNQNLSMQVSRRTETMLFQVAALNSRQSTRSVELDELGEIGFEVERRDRQFLRPSVTWTMNPTNRVSFGISGENVHYGGLDFSDYDYYAADLGWSHQLNEKTVFELSAFGSEYDSVPPTARVDSFFACVFQIDGIDGFNSETVGLQVGASRQPSDRFQYRGSIGYRDVTTTTERQCIEIDGSLRIINSSGSSEGFVLDTGMTYQGERFGVDLSVSRSVTPVGLGFLTERDDFSLRVTRRLTEKITLALLVNGFRTESIDDTFLFERDGLRVTTRANWRLNEKLTLDGGVRYRSNESLTSSGQREGVVVFAGFNYRFKPTTFSR